MQVMFIYYVHDLIENGTCPDPDDVSSNARILCVLTYTIACIAEGFETIGLWAWVAQMQTTPTTERLQLLRDPENGVPVGYASGLSDTFKRLVYVTRVLPPPCAPPR